MSAPSHPPGRPPSPLLVHASLLAVQLIFGGFHVIAKGVLDTVHPLALAGVRVLGATPLLFAAAWHFDRRLPSPRQLPRLALLGLLGVCVNQLLFITGLSHTTAINASILMPSIPVFAAALGALLGIEAIGRRRLAGIALAVAGALVLLDPFRFTLAEGTHLGNALVLANCLSFAAFLVLQRPILGELPWRTVIAWAFLFGGLGVLAAGARQLARLDLAALSAPTLVGLAYIVLLPTFLSYSLNTWAVRHSSPTTVAAYTTLQPVTASALAFLFLDERFGWHQGAGFALIVAGLWRVSKRSRGGTR